MGGHEHFEAPKSNEAVLDNHQAHLADYGMERGHQANQARDRQQKTDGLVDQGLLPSIDLMEMSNGFRTGKEVGARDLHDAGIKCTSDVDDDGRKTTSADYPNGIKVSVSEGKEMTLPDGHKVEIENSTLVEVQPPNKEDPTGSGTWVDGSGREIATLNKDGSVTVDTGKGFYTQYPDGLRKESALRSHDGKTFQVIDTDTPLGGLTPSDMAHQR